MNELKQLRADLMYIAHRQRALENAISEWSEFMTSELLKQGIRISKHQISDRYFRSTLRETHKQHYEKFESIFLKIKQLFGKRGRYSYK